MKQVSYETLDVFTEARFGGNPLAVITDASDLAPVDMQRIAREFNYSETTFVLPPEDAANSARVRIFTPASEIPFAGHPNVGTAFVLGRMGSVFGRVIGDRLRFEEGAGLVEVGLVRRDGQVTGASIRAPRELELSEELSADVVAGCASLQAGEIASECHMPVFASVGLPFIIAEVRSLESLARAAPEPTAFSAARKRYGGGEERFSLFLYVRMSATKLRARMFAPLSKVFEDPATGSAAAALGALFSSQQRNGEALQLTIEQGVEMGRPSLIQVRTEDEAGKHRIHVAGSCVPVMRGTLTL